MKLLSTTLLCVLTFLAFNAHAQSSNLSIQGIVKTIEGNAIENGDYDLTFKLYDVAVAGTILWQETIEDVNVKGGVYSIVLGAGSTPLDVPFDVPYYLGVSVEGDVDLYPRAQLTSSPYALSLIGDDNIFPNSGNVGVGADVPQHKLTVQRGDGVLGLEAVEDANNTAIITTTNQGMTLDAGGADKIYTFNNGRIDATADQQFTVVGTDTAQIILSNSNGNATLGFDPTNGDDLQLSNAIGATKIEGNDITLNPSNGTTLIDGNTVINGNTNIDGTVEVTKEGEALQLAGASNTQLAFYPTGIANGKKASIGVESNGQFLLNSTNSDIMLTAGSGKKVQANGYFYVNGYKYTNVPQGNHIHERYTSSTYAIRRNSYNYNLSIYATNGIRAHEFVVASDRRIKKDFSLSDGQKDLLTLSKIEVTDYRHVDEPANGKEIKKGLIAQQVEMVFPEAIKKGTDFIPNVFEMPVTLSLENGSLKVRLSKSHDFEIGDKIRIGTVTGDQDVIVSSIISPFEFRIDNWQGTDNKRELFIYGKEVNDFHTVDYDRIFTLNVSATQELTRQVEALKKENAQLKSKASKTDDLLKSLSAKVDALEQDSQMTGSK